MATMGSKSLYVTSLGDVLEMEKSPFRVLWGASAAGIAVGALASSHIGRRIAGSLALLSAMVSWIGRQKIRNLRAILFVALVSRLLLIAFGYCITLPDSSGDAIHFEAIGWEAAQAWLGGKEPPALSGAYAYSGLIAVIYSLFGRHTIIPLLVNAALGLAVVSVVFRLVLAAGGRLSGATYAAAIAAVFPTLNLYSAVLMRENVITFALALSVFWFVQWFKGRGWRYAVGSGALLVVGGVFHGGILIVGLVYGVLLCLYNPRSKSFTPLSRGALLAISLAATVLILISRSSVSKLPANLSGVLSPNYVQEAVSGAARSRAAYLVGMVPHSLGEIILQTPLRVLYFLLAPFPWMISTPSDLFGAVDAFLYLLLGIGILRTLWLVKKQNRAVVWLLTLVLIVTIIVFSWGTSNYGTAIRHRQKVSWLLITIAGVTLPAFRISRHYPERT